MEERRVRATEAAVASWCHDWVTTLEEEQLGLLRKPSN
jgi:hypothetical protein